MSDAVLAAIIGVVGGLLTTYLGIVAKRLGAVTRDVAAVKHEVKNDHSTNLREEQDQRHGENTAKLDQILDVVGWLAQGWIENREDITTVLEHTGQGNTRRARRLARTRPPINRTDIPGGTP